MVLNNLALTGSSGMLGSHIRECIENNDNVTLIPISRTSSKNILKSWDQTEWKSNEYFDDIFEDTKVIIHAGAMVDSRGNADTKKIYDANVRSCLNIGNWAIERDVAIIYISGAIVYEDTFKLKQKESSKKGWHGYGGFYGFSKLLAEDIFLRLADKGLKLSILRPTSIYGKGMPKDSIISSFLSKASNGEIIKIKEPVDEKVDLIHASDVANAVELIIKQEEWGIFNLSSGNPVSIQEIAESCISLNAGESEIKICGKSNQNSSNLIRYSLDNTYAEKTLNWSPKIDLLSGLKLMKDDKFI